MSDRKYTYELRGNNLIRVYSREYAQEYHEALNGQVERRMQQSIIAVGSLWYSAWVDAGMPEPSTFLPSVPYQEPMPADTLKGGEKKINCD